MPKTTSEPSERDWVEKQLDDPEFRKGFLDALSRQHAHVVEGLESKLAAAERERDEARAKHALASPDDLRDKEWTVAAHNDYRQAGRPHTFWLLTHHDGRWLKGEGLTDAMALEQIRDSLATTEEGDGTVS